MTRFGVARDEIEGAWPEDASPQTELRLLRDPVTSEIRDELWLCTVRLEEPWHLPAVLQFGDWNACPRPALHCAIHRYWQEGHGAEIVGVSARDLECFVSRPPETRDDALQLAVRQYIYCSDIVIQEAGTLAKRAALLFDAPYWSFWWE